MRLNLISRGGWEYSGLCPNAITTDRITKTTNVPKNYTMSPLTPIVLASSMENRNTRRATSIRGNSWSTCTNMVGRLRPDMGLPHSDTRRLQPSRMNSGKAEAVLRDRRTKIGSAPLRNCDPALSISDRKNRATLTHHAAFPGCEAHAPGQANSS
jgi:hypothetical protein